MKKIITTCIVLGLATLGCNVKTASTDSSRPSTTTVHTHANEGPHHGTLIELGNEAYHAELVLDNKSVTVYMLDGTAKKQSPIAAPEVIINLLHDGKPEQFKLAASPEASDPTGTSSRFESTDAELAGHLDEKGSAPKLKVSIDGKSYGGVIQHEHAGHDH